MKQLHTFSVGERLILTLDGGEAVIKGSSSASRATLIGRATLDDTTLTGEVQGEGGLVLTLPRQTALEIEGDVHNLVLRNLSHVRLGDVDGNLVASQVSSLDVSGSLEGEVALNQIGNAVTLDSVAGNLAIREAQDVTLRSVNGNAALERIGNVTIESLDGNLSLREAASLSVSQIEGNASVSNVSGAITVDDVEGRLSIAAPGPTVSVERVEGEVYIEGYLHSGGHYKLSAEGDIRLRVEGDARIVARGASEVQLGPTIRESEEMEEGTMVYLLGEGENPATVELELDEGVLYLNSDERRVHYVWGHEDGFPGSTMWSDEVQVEVQQAMREAREEIRRATETMRQDLRSAFRRGGPLHETMRGPLGDFLSALRPEPPAPPHAPRPPHAPPPPSPPSTPVTPNRDEMKLILTMLQEGQISADEAERLIAALSGRPTA